MKTRILSVVLALLCALALLSCLAVSVSAEAGAPTISVESVRAIAGGTVSVPIVIENNPGIAGARFTVSFDERLTLTDADASGVFDSLDYTPPARLEDGCPFNWDSLDAVAGEDGTLLTLTFAVSERAEVGEELFISVEYTDGDIYDTYLGDVSVMTVGGAVEIVDFLPGDANGDGAINGKDVTVIRAYNAETDAKLSLNAADVNADGKVNGKDVSILRRYNAGWDVELLPGCAEHVHTVVIDPAVSPTYDSTGLTEGSHCSACGEVLVAQQVLPMLTPEGSEGLDFLLNADGAGYTVMGIGECTDFDVVIPATYRGLPVTRIGELGMWIDVESVAIPESVEYVEMYAFCCNYSLTRVTFAGNSRLKSIGDYAFSGCMALAEIEIPAGVTHVGEYAFSGCYALEGVTLPASLSSLAHNAFADCDSLAEVIFASGSQLTELAEEAFRGCTSLKKITLPESLSSIGAYAFAYSGLLSLALPASLGAIESDAFVECYRLVEICNLSSLAIRPGNQDHGCVAQYASNVYTATEGSSMLWTDADGYVFYDDGFDPFLLGYEGDEAALTLPESCRGRSYWIRSRAFYRCENLESVAISAGVKGIGQYAFFECTLLEEVSFAEDGCLRRIDQNAFEWCRALNALELPEGVTSIGFGAFNGCLSLTSIALPASLESIDEWAFLECCYALERITVADGSETYRSVDNCLIEIGRSALILGCKNSVIPTDGSVEIIGAQAFNLCMELFEITIPASVTVIEYDAFTGCESLTGVTFAEGSRLIFIAENAFLNCYALESITIPRSVEYIGASAFSDCPSLTSVYFEEESQLLSIEGMTFYNCYALESITIPKFVEFIDWGAFSECTSLTSVSFEEGSQLTWIGGLAFCNCYALESITIPKFVEFIDWGAFSECTSLTSVSFEEGSQLIRIGESAFFGCASLTSVTIPASVEVIEGWAFGGCCSLEAICFEGTAEEWEMVEKLDEWDADCGEYTLYFLDGDDTAPAA